MSQPSPTTSVESPASSSPLRNVLLGIVAVLALCAGWYVYRELFPPEYSFGIPDDPRVTNEHAITANQLLDLPLVDSEGQPVSLRKRLGQKHLVIVITRGSLRSVPWRKQQPQAPEFPGICAYCSSQASGIASRLSDFEKQDAEVLLIFPVQQKVEFADAETMRKAATDSATDSATKQTPTLLLDVDCAAIDRLKIREHLARPSSFIIDKNGHLRFAYVAASESWADRPSGNELLRHVTQVNLDFQK